MAYHVILDDFALQSTKRYGTPVFGDHFDPFLTTTDGLFLRIILVLNANNLSVNSKRHFSGTIGLDQNRLGETEHHVVFGHGRRF